MSAPSSMLDAALGYASRGWHVFPVKPGTKEPLSALAKRGHLDATTDPAKIRSWWTRAPSAWVGVSCAASGLVVVDVDSYKSDCEFDSLASRLGPLPATLTQSTARGGRHHFFRDAGGVDYRNPCAGVEAKHQGYVVVAPSEGYAFDDPDAPVADLPAAWLGRLAKPKANGVHAPARPETLDAASSQLGRLFAGAKKLGESLDGGKRAIVCPWKDEHTTPANGSDTVIFPGHVGEFHCSHAHCAERRAADVMAKLDPDGSLVGAMAREKSEAKTPLPEAQAFPWGDLASAIKNRGNKRDWLFEGAIEDRPMVLWVGPEKGGKSWIMIDAAVSAILGQPWLGMFPCRRPGPVFYLDSEYGKHEFARRLERICRGRGVSVQEVLPKMYYYQSLDLKLKTQPMTPLFREAERIKPVLVVLDPFRNHLDGDENVGRDVINAMAQVAKLRDLGNSSIIIPHHQNRDDNYAGSRAIMGRFDLMVETEKDTYFARGRTVRPFDGIAQGFAIKIEHRNDEGPSPGEDHPDAATIVRAVTAEAKKEADKQARANKQGDLEQKAVAKAAGLIFDIIRATGENGCTLSQEELAKQVSKGKPLVGQALTLLQGMAEDGGPPRVTIDTRNKARGGKVTTRWAWEHRPNKPAPI